MRDLKKDVERVIVDAEESVHSYVKEQNKSNAFGLAGLIISVLALLALWIPIVGKVIWLLGAILSLTGLTKTPKGFAMTGTIISFLGLILYLLNFLFGVKLF